MVTTDRTGMRIGWRGLSEYVGEGKETCELGGVRGRLETVRDEKVMKTVTDKRNLATEPSFF